jgi:2-iminobutanoate/2-iminopropanoate deaminase
LVKNLSEFFDGAQDERQEIDIIDVFPARAEVLEAFPSFSQPAAKNKKFERRNFLPGPETRNLKPETRKKRNEEVYMPKEHMEGDARQKERAYSPAVKVKGGTTIYVAGHTGFQDDAGKTYPGDLDAQVRVCFERMGKTLERAGGSLDDIVTMTVFITDMANGTRFTQLRRQFFKEGHYPASALIGIKELARPEMMIEIQGIAVID